MSNPNLSTKMINSKSNLKKEDSIRSVSHCSCSQCNLDDCFTIRYKNSPSNCTCNACKLAILKTDSEKLSLKDHKKLVKLCAHSNEPLKDPINSTADTNIQSSTRNDSESKIKSKIIEIRKEIFPEIADNEFSKIDDNKYTEYRCKDVSVKKEKLDWNEDRQVYEKSSTKKYIHSVAITYSPKERKNSTVKLSAQIMDMPYEEVKDSLATDSNKVAQPVDLPYEEFKDALKSDNVPKIETEHETTPSPNIIDLMKPDILTRLKEIYKACSCKFCECIAGKPLTPNNESCGCSPCDCELCTKTRNKIKADIIKPPHSGCPCVRCDRKDCRGVVKNTGDAKCDCKPCECIKCVENVPKSCSCLPCQCTECIALGLSLPQSFVVAPVQGSFRHNMCQCEPCECDNCTHNYTAMSSNLRREMSTDVSHGNCHCDSCSNNSCETNNACRCDVQNKIVKKPLENAPNYDIHRTVVSYRDQVRSKIMNQDTIAMYALSNNYSKTIQNSKIDGNCHCLNCDCFVCNVKSEYDDEQKKMHCETIEMDSELSSELSSICKCSPCDCQICNNHNKQNNELGDKCLQKYCACKECDCFICRGLLQYSKNERSIITNHLYHEVPYSPLQETLIFPKRGRILTPSAFEANVHSTLKIQNQIDKLSSYKKVTVWHPKSKHNVPREPNVRNEITKPINSRMLKNIYNPENEQLNENSKYVAGEKISDLKRNIVLSKNNAKNSLKLDDIFNPSKQNPIRNIDLLNECIYLVKSLDKIDSEADFNISLKCSENIMQAPNSFQHTFYKAIDSEKFDDINIDNDENYLIFNNNEILDKVSSKSINLCDKTISIESEIRHFIEDIIFKNDLKQKDAYNQSLIPPKKFLSSIGPKNEIIETAKEYNEVEYCDNATHTHTMLSKYNLHNKNLKSKRNKGTQDKVTKSVNMINYQANVEEFDVNKDILPIIDKLISNLESEIHNIENLALMAKNNLHQTENTYIQNMDEKQNVHKGKVNKSWPVLKNLHTTCTQAYDKSDCGVFAMELDDTKNLESISMQTSDLCHVNRTKKGKEALTLLLNEVKNLLSSPLLQSTRSSHQSADMGQTSNFLLQNTMDQKYKSIHSDAVSQTIKNRIPVDKETHCNFLQPMESLYISMKQLVDLILARAAHKSEITTTKYNFTHGCVEEIPKINSARSSCDGLKAAFIGLRTISDHTVMVKWRLPRQVVHVQGYELQVDGRPVQKIFSPTRCMAVLTCLPHTDKLLLTIRTITTSLPSDHNPATTIVYRPRVK